MAMRIRSKLILFIIFILVVGFGLYYLRARLADLLSLSGGLEEGRDLFEYEEWGEVEGEGFIFSERAERFYISGKDTLPAFIRELNIDPFEVREGEEQIFSVWAKDINAVEKVTALVFNDTGEQLIKLQLVRGTEKEGEWMGSWITKDILAEPQYSTLFRVVNKEGKDSEMTISWQAANE